MERIPDTSRKLAPTVLAIGMCQILGWGASFNLPGVIGPSIASSFDSRLEIILLGPSIMLTVLALCSWWMAPVIERNGARVLMMIGAGVMAVGLVAMTASQSVTMFLASWILVGIGGAAALSTPAQIALKEIFGDRARQAIGAMSLVSGLANTILWPILARMESAFGWRVTTMLMAGSLVFVYVPTIRLVGARRLNSSGTPIKNDHSTQTRLDPWRFALVAAVTALNGFITWGFSLTLIPLLMLKGQDNQTAVLLASALGIVTVAARMVEVFGNWTPLQSAVVSTVTLMASFLLLALGGSLAVAVSFIVLYGFAGGLMSVVRATLPLTIFPPDAYARAASRLALPLNLSFAAAPPVFAWILERSGAITALGLSMGLGTAATLCVLALIVLVRHQGNAAKPA